MPLNPNIPLQAVQPRNSLTQDYAQALQMKGVQQQIKAQEQAMAREAARRNALSTAYDPTTGAVDYTKAEAALAGAGDIEGAMGIRGQRQKERELDWKMKGEQRKSALAEIDAEAQLLGGAKDQATYDMARQRAQSVGLDVSDWPPEYNPQMVESAINAALDAKTRVEIERNAERDKFDREDKDRNYKLNQQKADREPLVEIYDPNSPTGTSYVSRSQAVGKAGKPPSGMEITLPDGTVVRQGRNSGAGGLTTSTTSKVEQDALEQGSLLSQLNDMEAGFKPEYFTIGGRFRNATRGMRASIDPKLLSVEEQKQYSDFRDFKANTARTQASIINKLYGAALSGGEAKRADQFLVTDSDDAITAQRKIKQYREFVNKAVAKNAYIMANGLGVNSVDVEQMPKIMRSRGDEIAKELSAQGLAGEELKSEVKRKLASEFGLAPP